MKGAVKKNLIYKAIFLHQKSDKSFRISVVKPLIYLHLIFEKSSWMNLIFYYLCSVYPAKFNSEIDKKSTLFFHFDFSKIMCRSIGGMFSSLVFWFKNPT